VPLAAVADPRVGGRLHDPTTPDGLPLRRYDRHVGPDPGDRQDTTTTGHLSGAEVPGPGYVMSLNGSYSVGTSFVLEYVGDLLAAAGRPVALMDVDWSVESTLAELEVDVDGRWIA